MESGAERECEDEEQTIPPPKRKSAVEFQKSFGNSGSHYFPFANIKYANTLM
jgi:hypothetical protein